MDKGNTKSGGHKIGGVSLHVFFDLLSVGYTACHMLCNSCELPYSGTVGYPQSSSIRVHHWKRYICCHQNHARQT